jgi:hypothetical protein
VIHAIGLGGLAAGVDIGARCHRLYVDFNKPVALIYLQTESGGGSGRLGWTLPWDSAFHDLELYVQAAWADSQTNALSLATALRLWLVGGMPLEPARQKSIESFVPYYLAALSVVHADPAFFSFTRYEVK